MLHSSRASGDAVVGVARVHAAHPEFDVRLVEGGLIRPYAAGNFSSLKRRQDIEELYFLEGSLDRSAVGRLFRAMEPSTRDRTLGYVVPRWKSFEEDELLDLICIEAILSRREELRSGESTTQTLVADALGLRPNGREMR